MYCVVEKMCANGTATRVDPHLGETLTNGRKCDITDRPGNSNGAEFLNITDRQTENKRRREQKKEVELEDTQRGKKNDDVDNSEKNRRYADESNEMGNCRADAKKDPSGENREKQMGASMDCRHGGPPD